jgi:hypothetical protein
MTLYRYYLHIREDVSVFILFLQSAQMVCSIDPKVPVIADADTG